MQQRKTIRILLISPDQRVLFMRAVDPTTTSLDIKPRAAFWCTVGGKMEAGETVEQTTYRELLEETGLTPKDIIVGPTVWYGRHQMILSGQLVELDEKFVVVHALHTDIMQDNFTDNEKAVVTRVEWLSLEQITNHHEPIFPAILKTYLPAVLAGDYPQEPLWVNLSLQPTENN